MRLTITIYYDVPDKDMAQAIISTIKSTHATAKIYGTLTEKV